MSAPLADEHDRLRRDRKNAGRRLNEAKRAVADEWKLNRALLAPLWDRRHKRQSRTTSFLRSFSDDLLAQINERGLAFDLSDADRSVVLIDPAAREELVEARDARTVADQRLRAFESEHADALRAEAEAAEAAGIRDALAGDDPNAIRRALAGAGK